MPQNLYEELVSKLHVQRKKQSTLPLKSVFSKGFKFAANKH